MRPSERRLRSHAPASSPSPSSRPAARRSRRPGNRPGPSGTSSCTGRKGASRAGRPITASGPGATRSSSASAAATTRTAGRTTTSTTTGPRSSSWPAAATAGSPGRSRSPEPPGALVGTPGMRHGTFPPGAEPERLSDPDEPIDFRHPDFAMTVRMENSNNGRSRYYVSYDRGHTWRGPYRLPLFGQKGVMGRTDYLVERPARVPAVPDRLEGRRPGGPALLRADDRRRADLGVPRLHRPRAERLRDHAVHGPGLGDGPRDDHPTEGPAQELDRRLRLARRRAVLGVPLHPGAGHRRGQPAEPDQAPGRPALPDLRGPRQALRHPRPAERRPGPDLGRRGRPARRRRRATTSATSAPSSGPTARSSRSTTSRTGPARPATSRRRSGTRERAESRAPSRGEQCQFGPAKMGVVARSLVDR